ncbi:hypothetical protein WJ58_26165 [Burkholderia ubonensis]|uniref:DUF4240 domain-containing protein n=1 Tax=Burkholderia ubonensis TaxID=101571 RepID=UPI00075A4FC0|nr:DUF4240 domain-containing protein [Burkholderia ubonensis]KVM48924.1 hypothetical protein WJ58_26165 [Burkholderia ubonensis]
MNQKKFWKIIDKCQYADNPDLRLEELLDCLPRREVRAFDWIFQTFESYANRRDVYVAARLLGQAPEYEDFENFIRGLIAKGQHVYEAALGDPDTLRWLVCRESIDNESIAWVARIVYARKMGISIFEAMDDLIASRDQLDIELTIYGDPYETPEIEVWDFDDEQENRKRLPKLSRAVYDTRLVAIPDRR